MSTHAPQPAQTLAGKVVAITGASSGIGEACALRFARAGAAVALMARRPDRLSAVARRIEQAGGRAIAMVGDVTASDAEHESDVASLVGHAIESFGRLDVMVANAGAGYHGTIDETSVDVARRLMEVNFIGTFIATRAALPVFKKQGSGHLVIVSSIVGRRGIAGTSAYGATKAAQLGFAESLRAELAGTGVHVTTVYPVATRTEFHDAIRRDHGHVVKGLGPQQSADEVAAAIEGALISPRPEVYPHRLSRMLAIAGVLAPGLADKLVQKYGRRRAT